MLCIGILADAVCAILLTSIAAAADVDYYRDVYPILKSNCVSCHNTTTTEGGLNLESPQVLRTGGDSGPGVVPGKSADSLIYQSAAHIGDVIMPPPGNGVGAKKLTTEELAVLGAWINGGAKDSVRQVQNLAWRAPVANVSPIYAVEVSPDGRWGIAGHANQISLFDLESRQFISRISDPAADSAAGNRNGKPEPSRPRHSTGVQPGWKAFCERQLPRSEDLAAAESHQRMDPAQVGLRGHCNRPDPGSATPHSRFERSAHGDRTRDVGSTEIDCDFHQTGLLAQRLTRWPSCGNQLA